MPDRIAIRKEGQFRQESDGDSYRCRSGMCVKASAIERINRIRIFNAHMECPIAVSSGSQSSDRLDNQDERDTAHQESITDVANVFETGTATWVFEGIDFLSFAM